MRQLTTIQKKYMDVAEVFHFATRDHYVLWFTGGMERHKQTERVLPALVRKGFLNRLKYGKRFVYATPDRVYMSKDGQEIGIFPAHGLACTAALTRFIRSDMNGEAISEQYFQKAKWGVFPEWGILYPGRSVLLFEFHTRSNAQAYQYVPQKIARYRKELHNVKEAMNLPAVVLFVLQLTRAELVLEMKKYKLQDEPFYFTDWETFLSVPFGEQLTAPIYIWGGDGKSYPLRNV